LLALDPMGDPERATIGATIATSSYGPLAHHFGTPRDMTLGVEIVTGAGDIVRGGGRVVKNVAGFDLTRLVTGSWGTLGIVTEVSVRLRALPAVETTLAVDVSNDATSIERVRSALRRLPFTPLAAQVLSPSLARLVGVGSGDLVLLFRIGGNEEAVRSQLQGLGVLGAVRECPMTSWNALRTPEPPDTAVVRLSRLPSRFAETWQDAFALVQSCGGHCHGDPGRGVVRCVLPPKDGREIGALRKWLDTPYSGTRLYERLPRELWTSVPLAGHARLSSDIKRAFDPAGVLNPGLLGDLS
jgi:glycolate oxidase FAD binding subunit